MPHLVSVLGAHITSARQHHHVALVRHIHNSEGVFIVVEADLVVSVRRIRARVDHTLGVVCVSTIKRMDGGENEE